LHGYMMCNMRVGNKHNNKWNAVLGGVVRLLAGLVPHRRLGSGRVRTRVRHRLFGLTCGLRLSSSTPLRSFGRTGSSTPLVLHHARPAKRRARFVPGRRLLQPNHLVESCQALCRVLRRSCRGFGETHAASHHAEPSRCSGSPILCLSTMDGNSMASVQMLPHHVGKVPLLPDALLR
jgi:hypothetical protein